MKINTFKTFIEEFKDVDESTKKELLEIYNSHILISIMKRKLQKRTEILNQNIVELQKSIDKYSNIMLETIGGTEEYRHAKVKHDINKEEKYNKYGDLLSVKETLNMILEKEEADRLEMEYNHYMYCKEVGAYELPF